MSDANHSSGERVVRGALALELTPGSAVGADRLDQAGAGKLRERVAADLARCNAEAADLELALVGAHYGPVELLRHGWPLHRELAQLAARAPGDRSAPGGRIVAFGA